MFTFYKISHNEISDVGLNLPIAIIVSLESKLNPNEVVSNFISTVLPICVIDTIDDTDINCPLMNTEKLSLLVVGSGYGATAIDALLNIAVSVPDIESEFLVILRPK